MRRPNGLAGRLGRVLLFIAAARTLGHLIESGDIALACCLGWCATMAIFIDPENK